MSAIRIMLIENSSVQGLVELLRGILAENTDESPASSSGGLTTYQ